MHCMPLHHRTHNIAIGLLIAWSGIRLVRDGELMLSTVEQRIEILLSDDRVAEFATTAVDPDEAGEDEPAEQPQ